MTCQSLISDLSDVESPSVATARMHLLLRFSRYGPEKLTVHADGPWVCTERLKSGCSTSLTLFLSRWLVVRVYGTQCLKYEGF